jgi:hypothetical protein
MGDLRRIIGECEEEVERFNLVWVGVPVVGK